MAGLVVKILPNCIVFLNYLEISFHELEKDEKENRRYQITLHDKTIEKIEDATQKRFSHNGEKLILEILNKKNDLVNASTKSTEHATQTSKTIGRRSKHNVQ